jgi:hypothetical protein
MKIEITQEINKEYYREYYSEWLNFRSKFKKWEHIIGFTSLFGAVVTYLVDNSIYYISFGLLVFGGFMIYEFYFSKQKWLNDRLKSKMNNSEVKMTFEDDKIQSFGPFTEMKGEWSFFTDAIETNKGLILIPENGISIYLQKKVFQSQSDIKEIIRKVQEN